MQLRQLLLLCSLLFTLAINAQNATISGRISGDDSYLPFATIHLKNSDIGVLQTKTDITQSII